MKKIILATLFLLIFTSTHGIGQNPTKPDIERVVDILGDNLVFDWAERSYSPMYSDIGMVFGTKPGLIGIYFHYNYKRIAIKDLLEIDAELVDTRAGILGIKQIFTNGSAEYSFFDHNSFLVQVQGVDSVALNFKPNTEIPIKGLGEYRFTYAPWLETVGDVFIFKGYMRNQDRRDPDPMYPIAIGVRVLSGGIQKSDASGLDLKANGNGIKLAVSFQILDIDNDALAALVKSAPNQIEQARQLTQAWFAEAIGALPIVSGTEKEQNMAATAAMTLAFNACRANGIYNRRVASFPNRGNYAAHFQWDAAFQNLGYEMMQPRLAEDAMLIMTESVRADGKMGQFVTSTWLRPIEIQVPLIGWASRRLYEQRRDTAFIQQILPPLVQNNQWILNNRMTHYGLTTTLTPWELWDDTPRLDNGPILACDFNADLLMQIQACEYFATELGDAETAARCREQADQLAKNMMQLFYDPVDNRFKDVLVETGEQLDILTPAAFVPLLADVPISDSKARDMIETYLLDPNKLFGPIPFPSVAYDESTYVPDEWEERPGRLSWRGPTWLPMAWMMLEVLQKYGYDDEYTQAATRLYEMIIEDGELSELFNSQTGEGLGVPQQGWTAAIFLKLKSILNR